MMRARLTVIDIRVLRDARIVSEILDRLEAEIAAEVYRRFTPWVRLCDYLPCGVEGSVA